MYTWILTFEKISFHQCFVVLQKFYGRKSCRSFHRVFANHDFSVSESFLRQWFFSNLFSNNLFSNPLNKTNFMNGPNKLDANVDFSQNLKQLSNWLTLCFAS